MTASISTSSVSSLQACSPVALHRLREQQRFAAEHRRTFSQLSGREREVLALVARGLSNQDIAGRLYLSVHTIRTHRQNIRQQLHIHNTVEAIWWAQSFDLA